tara:strand:+ start:9820 stop:10221 length:402 start_codon:yes stop_codon:yes gene_type:complete
MSVQLATIIFDSSPAITYWTIPEGTTAIMLKTVNATKALGLGIQTFDPTAVNATDPDWYPGVVNPSIALWEIGLSADGPDTEEWIILDSLESTQYTYGDPDDRTVTRFPRLEIHKAPLLTGNTQYIRAIFFQG